MGPGDLYGYEYRYEESIPELSADWIPARSRIPLVRGEYDLELPTGWAATGFWIERMGDESRRLPPEVSKPGHWKWDWRDLPGSGNPEPYEPSNDRLIPSFFVRYTARSGRAAGAITVRKIAGTLADGERLRSTGSAICRGGVAKGLAGPDCGE